MTPQSRWNCPVCMAEGWWTPSTHVGPVPLDDHDRPDGGTCYGSRDAYAAELRGYLANLIDILTLKGHAMTRRDWERATLLAGRTSAPMPDWDSKPERPFFGWEP